MRELSMDEVYGVSGGFRFNTGSVAAGLVEGALLGSWFGVGGALLGALVGGGAAAITSAVTGE